MEKLKHIGLGLLIALVTAAIFIIVSLLIYMTNNYNPAAVSWLHWSL